MTYRRSLVTAFLLASLPGAMACGGSTATGTGATGTGATTTTTSGTGGKGTGGTGTTTTGTGGVGTGGSTTTSSTTTSSTSTTSTTTTTTTTTSPNCGTATCMAGQVCLEKSGGAFMEPMCVTNPCGSQTLSCTCAGSLCPGSPFVCSVSGNTVHCDCPACP